MQTRFDLYRNIHKGLRAMLGDLVQKSGRTDFTDPEDVASLIGATQDVFELFTHMADEELELNPALWSGATDETLGEIEGQIVGSIPPDKMMRYLRWMVPAMNPREREELAAVLPPPVREIVASLA